ncbi:MAG: translation initiation factor [Ferruginibacter sp.]
MNRKKQGSTGGLVYSTDPGFKIEEPDNDTLETIAPALQKLKIKLDSKQRAGKSVTLVLNFAGKTSDREELGKKLKTFCGTGGSVKDGEIIIQGDNRDKVLQWLLKNGYTTAKKI